MRVSGSTAAALLTLVCGSTAVGAQPLVGATVGISKPGAGANDQPYLGPPFGGTSFAASASVDSTSACCGTRQASSVPVSSSSARLGGR
jgi:hypothetical protein